MIFPLLFGIINAAAALEQRKIDLRLMERIASQSDSVISSAGLTMLIPALFTRMSTPPYSCFVLAKSSSTDPALVMSQGTEIALPPRNSISFLAESEFSRCTEFTTTLAPSSANFNAIARPIPLPEPVMMATLF